MLNYSPKNPNNQDNSWLGKVYLIGGLLLLLGLLLVFSGCSPRIVEHITVQRDTVKVVQRDSVRFYDRDSIFIREKGDTVYQYVEKWRWRDRVKVDTFYRTRVDSVAVFKDKIVEVEKPLSGWQKFQIRGVWYLCAAFLLLAAWWSRKWWLPLLKL